MTGGSPAAPVLLRRLGLAGEPADLRFGWRVVAAVLAIYVLSFAIFYPEVATNDDEASYIVQVRMLLAGVSEVTHLDALTGEVIISPSSTYSLGMSLITAPFVAVFGWRGSFAVACLGLVAMVVLTGRWVALEGRSPVFALLLLGVPSVLVLGRVAMSDVPSGALVALGLYLFWRGLDRGFGWWMAAGLVAGASWALRASNPLLFVPLFVGTVLRWEWRKFWALVVGGLVGLSLRLGSHQLFFGEAFFERAYYKFSPFTLDERLPLYLLGLLILVPGGLIFASLYRGRRRPELLITIAVFILLYLFQKYSSIETSLSKRLVLALRYMVPLLPVLIFSMSESVPRLWERWRSRSDFERRVRVEFACARIVMLWLAIVGLACAVVHPAFAAWSSTQAELRAAISEFVPGDAVLLTNQSGTRKFIDEFDRRYRTLRTENFPPARVSDLVLRHAAVYLVVLDRSDSTWWNGETRRNAEYFERIPTGSELLTDIRPNSTDRLRIWRLTR
ncbi:MAG: hypothetical protein AAEJ52_23225 [Myxococcota bacterium]